MNGRNLSSNYGLASEYRAGYIFLRGVHPKETSADHFGFANIQRQHQYRERALLGNAYFCAYFLVPPNFHIFYAYKFYNRCKFPRLINIESLYHFLKKFPICKLIYQNKLYLFLIGHWIPLLQKIPRTIGEI